MAIQKAEKLYTVVLTDWLEFVITETDKKTLEAEMMTENFVNINWNIFNKYEIKRIIEKKQKSSKWYSYICEYWTRHPMYGKEWCEECKCYDKFWCYHFTFYDWLTDRWYRFEYASDIKPSWQSEFLKQKQNNKS